MIADLRENLYRYKGIHPGLDMAIDYLMSPEADGLEGRIELDGDRVYVSAQDAELCSMEERQWEVHRKYMDIHMGVTDGEALGYLNKPDGINWQVKGPDLEFSSDPVPGGCVRVDKDMFVILWPNEPHKPNTGCGNTRKLVAKILL